MGKAQKIFIRLQPDEKETNIVWNCVSV